MKLYDLLDKNLLNRHLEYRFVGVQKHPTLPLRIFNYTHLAQYDGKQWGDGTIDYCRGLVVDAEDNIVARPFRKFHNFQSVGIPETWPENIPDTEPMITEKMDGSLGILWQYDGDYGIATRGSFTSPQALWATNWLNNEVGRERVKLPYDTNWTWLFEIIYDQNRIVLKYSYEGLVVLSLVNKHTGCELSYEFVNAHAIDLGFKVVRKIPARSLVELMAENKKGEEGYVVTYLKGLKEQPLKIKIKFEDYVRLHKIVTGMNARSVWELLKASTPFDITGDYPEHFKMWYISWQKKLESEFSGIYWEAVQGLYINRPINDGHDARKYRATYAAWVTMQDPKYKGLLFALLDGKNIDEAIWDMIEPRGDDRSFREDE